MSPEESIRDQRYELDLCIDEINQLKQRVEELESLLELAKQALVDSGSYEKLVTDAYGKIAEALENKQ